MPPVYLYVVRDDSSDKPQEENKSTDANNGAPAAPEKPTGSNAGLIAGSITSVAVVIFLLIVILVPYIKKRRQQNEANKSISGPTRPVTQYLGSDLAYNRGQRRLSLVDKLATQPPRQSGELSRSNSRISVLSAMVPRSPRDPFADPVRRSSFTYKKGSPTLPMQTVPENVDTSGVGYYDEKEVAKSASPLSAYIQHHLQTYSANGAQSNFPVSAPAYQTGFNVPGRNTDPAADDFSPHSPETPYTASVYAPSEASDYDDHHHHIPPPSAPPSYMYSQEAAQDRARALPPRSPRVSDLLRRRDRSSQYSNGTSSDRSSVAESDRPSRKAGRRPAPLPLSPDEPEFTINPVEYHHHDEHHDEVWTAAHMPLPQSAAPPLSVRSARSAGGLSARTPSRVPIPVTPIHDDHDDHVVISPTPDHGTSRFTDIPYPRSR